MTSPGGGTLAEAAVEITAETGKFEPELARKLNSAGSAAGKASQGIGRRIAAGITSSFSRIQAPQFLKNFASGFRSAESAASSLTGRMGTLGGAARSALQPAIAQVGSFVSGFRDSRAAASSFSGTMGSLGGRVRSALQPAIQGVGSFVSGFRDSRAAASAFSGTMGTIGGRVRSAVQPAMSAFSAMGRGITAIGGGASRAFGVVRSAASSTASGVSGLFSRFASSAQQQIESRVGGAFDRVKSLAAGALGAIGVAGIGGAIMSGVNRVAQIEQVSTSLKVMMGNAQKAQGFMDELLGFAKTTPFAFPDIADAGRNLLAFGMDAKSVVPTLKAVGDAAAASGKGSEALKQLGDVFGQIQIKGKLQGDELMQLSEAGVPALKILANQAGISAAEMSDRISKGTVSSEEAIQGLVKGIENGTDGIAGHTAKMGGVMSQLQGTWTGTLDKLKSSISSTMANLITPMMPTIKKGILGIAGLFSQLPTLLASVGQKLESAGVFDAIKTFFSGIGSVVKGALPGIKTFGSYFVGALAAVTLALKPLGNLLSAVGGWMQRNAGFVKMLGAALGVAAAGLVAYRVASAAAAVATRLLSAAMTASPIGIVITAIGLLVGAFIYLWNNSEGFRNFWIGLWNSILAIVQPVVSWFQTTVLPFFTGLWNQIIAAGNAFAAWWSALWNSQIGAVIQIVLQNIWTVVSTVWNAIVAIIQGAMTAIWSVIQGVWSAISGVISGALSVIQGIIQVFTGILTLNWSQVWEGIKNIVSGVWSAITGIVSGAINAVKGIISGVLSAISGVWSAAWNGLTSVISNVWNGIKTGVQNGINAVLGFLRELPGKIIDFFAGAGTWLLDAGKKIIQGLIDGIKNMIGAVGDAISNVASAITDFLPFSPAKKGPLSGRGAPVYSGRSIGRQLAQGIHEQERLVQHQMRHLVRLPASRALRARSGYRMPVTPAQSGAAGSGPSRSYTRSVEVHAPITVHTAARDPHITAARTADQLARLAQA